MEILRKIIDCKTLGNSHGNCYGGVSFSRVTSPQFSGCNFAIKGIHHRFFLGNVPKTKQTKNKNKNTTKKVFFEKKVYSGPAS